MNDRRSPGGEGEPSFLEIGVPSGARARDFYRELLGWQFESMGGDNYFAATSTAGIGLHTDDPDALMVVYFTVADIEAAVERVRRLGGTAPQPGGGDERFGRFVECRDSQGVRFGLRQPPRG
jgi:predicted enzyme related to lactoylglutathione lyase